MRTRAGISTSDMHFIISKTVSAVRADATEVPTSRHNSSSTNGLAATGPQSGSNFKKYISRNRLHYDQKNPLNPLVKSVFKSVHNHGRYLHFCDRHVCSIQYAATRRLPLRAWPILCTGLCPAQLFLVWYIELMIAKMKGGKTTDMYGVCVDHLIFSHTILPCVLANTMITTAIRLRSDYDVSCAPASIRREQKKNVNFSS